MLATLPTVTGAGFRFTDFASASVTVRAAKPAPNMNRITGPKLFAAASPTKYKPGTDDFRASTLNIT